MNLVRVNGSEGNEPSTTESRLSDDVLDGTPYQLPRQPTLTPEDRVKAGLSV